MSNYIPNDEAAIIAEDLIEKYHPHLKGCKIVHLLKIMPVPKKPKAPREGKKVVLAKVSKVTPKTKAIAADDYVFMIEYGSLYWDRMDDKFKRAVIDHELGHCGNDADGYYIKNHTIEDFDYMIERYGCYKRDVEDFVTAVLKKFAEDAMAIADSAVDETIAEAGANVQ